MALFRRDVRDGIVLAFLSVCGASGSPAQSLTAGTLSGTVSDSLGAPLYEVSVVATNRSTGIARATATPRTGAFTLRLLPAGVYDVFIELIGYRPVRITGVQVRAGRDYRLSATLVEAPPPVTSVDEVAAGAVATLDSRAGMSQWYSSLARNALPGEPRDWAGLARLSSQTTPAFETEGLPARAGGSGWLLDGLAFAPVAHPALGPFAPAMAFPLSGLDQAELVTGGNDVEWTGGAGILAGASRRGTPRVEAHGFADWTGDPVSSSKFFDTGAAPNSAIRGGVVVTGPVIRDTAAFMVGAEVQRLELPRPAAWVTDTALDSALVAVAQDSFSTDLAPYTRAGVRSLDITDVFGRFDWQLADNHGLSVRANAGKLTATDPDLGEAAPSLGATLEGKDITAAAVLTSALSGQAASELRFGIESSQRDYTRAGPPATAIVDGGLSFGADPALSGRFKRSTIRASETGYLSRGLHQLKGGLAVSFSSFDDLYGYGRGGAFAFAGADEYGQRQGAFTQAVGPIPAAKFTSTVLGLYAQDTWSASPGFDVQVGVRYELEQVPQDKITRNQAWFDSTGIDNARLQRGNRRFSPRLGLTWDVQNQHRWVVRTEAGIYHSNMDPALFDEIVTHDVGYDIRRGVGSLGRWPTAPDSVAAPVQGAAISMLAPRFAPPRSGRVALGITRAIRGVALHVAGAYRHTDFLPRRHDLNRLPGPNGTDQYGRPLYGTLLQEGSLLAAAPGSNRRFSGFDLVSSFDPDGSSDYYGVTLALEGGGGHALDFLASYTYSRTTDNWLGGRSGGPESQLTPFPDSLGGDDWANARSDFDLPHRLVFGAEWQLPGGLGLRLAGLFRYQSGAPFTPGFRSGVDMNGDGSSDNDPAYVDDALPQADSVIAAWSCLQTQVGAFAERNSCRDPAVKSLDLRLRWGAVHLGGYLGEIVVDALNVLESDVGTRDHALYLVDRAGTLSTNSATGVTTVPLVVNPNFGNLLVRRTTGRAFRIGLRFNY